MPLFQYKGRNQRGEAVRGHLEAVSPDAVAAQLMNSGVIPIDIGVAQVREDVFAGLKARLAASTRITLTDLSLFSRQMYTLIKAGVPIMQALRGLRDSTQNPALAKVIISVGESLDTGLDLTSALRRHPQVFSPLYVNMVQVGETTGSLQEVFLQLAIYLEREKDTRDRIKSATRYPMFVVAAIFIAIFIINLFVIPTFAKVYAGFKIELPMATQILIASSNFTVAYWPVILMTIITAVFALRYYVRTPEGRYRWHKMKLDIPVVGKVIYKATLGRFARALAVMMKSGVPLVQGMTVISRAVDNDYISDRIVQMRDGVERGETIARTAAATGMFPSLVIQMIAVGEDTGSVDELMFNVAEYYEREVDYDITNLSTALQPILIVFLSIMVFILALGVFLPMWDLAQVARKG
ncbi:MSHA biogenesis protein MshG [Sulfuricaulis limicola]|uniref:MSHA biogenesis protein MshG n=1 Tax=Sulfuricaulis limicola TaxID=1620215 RepID=A0A1B4XD00_9GAMM|nr:type II secretion system F family protein [Sulfuricaulis limicola]BAV32697.1 MSHA biogenesis protein MshG [Sulfuricaulis limicola]